MWCYEVALGQVWNRGSLVPSTEGIKGLQFSREEAYYSHFQYELEPLQKWLDRHKKVANFRGNAKVAMILLDIDKGFDEDPVVLNRLRNTVTHLRTLDCDEMRIWFSGTGYHIGIPNLFGIEPGETAVRTLRASMKEMFPEVDEIYDATRLVRMPYSLNRKSNLVKYPLTHVEVFKLTAGQILEKAEPENWAHVTEVSVDELFPPFEYTPIWEKARIEAKRGEIPADHTEITSYVGCMQKLFLEGPEVANINGSRWRHMKLLRLVSAWRRQGVPLLGALHLGYAWNKDSMGEHEVEKIVRDGYEFSYKYSCADRLMSHYCVGKQCKFYAQRNFNKDEQMSVRQLLDDFAVFAKGDWKERSIDLGRLHPAAKGHLMAPGEFNLLTADSGIGKTALLQNLLHKITLLTLYYNLEISNSLWTRRQIQIQLGVSKEEAIATFAAQRDFLEGQLSHIHNVVDAPTLDQLESHIYDTKAKLTVIDTADCILVPSMGNQTHFKDEKIARGLKEIAQRTDSIIVAVVHLSKGGVKELARTKELNKEDIRGSASYFQKADQVFAMEIPTWDPFAKLRQLRTLKARDETPLKAEFTYDTNTFRIEPFIAK